MCGECLRSFCDWHRTERQSRFKKVGSSPRGASYRLGAGLLTGPSYWTLCRRYSPLWLSVKLTTRSDRGAGLGPEDLGMARDADRS